MTKRADEDDPENDPLSSFLATFPAKLYYTETEYFPHRRVFWTQSVVDVDDVPDPGMIQDKIKTAFSDNTLSPLMGIIQFWAPTETRGGRRVLITSNQPFALAYLNSRRHKYRLSSLKYQYSIDDYEQDDPMIISGPPATAFLNRFPVVVDLRVHQEECPLVRSALECELTTSILLPVFYPSLSSCVGVVECSVNRCKGLVIFNYLKAALEKVGLTTYHVQESQLYKSMCSLKHATDEIEEALEIVCESHSLTLAQVWIGYENDNRFPFTPSLEYTQTRQKFAVKLIGYRDTSDDDLASVVKNYYDTCDMLPLKMGEGLAGKTLQSHEPHFCQDLSKLSDNGLLGLLSANTKCSCLAICLRSIDTGDLDYAFEFLWPQNRNYFLVLKSLLSTLKMRLPTFKLASGAELGNELRVTDVENSTGCGLGSFKTLDGNRLSSWKNCGNALGISQWQGPKFLKRKFDDLFDSRIDPNHQDPSTNVVWKTYGDDDDDEVDGSGDDDVFLVATYQKKTSFLFFPRSSTLANVKEEIDEKLNLDPGTYNLELKFDEQKCAKLNNEKDFSSCIKAWTSARMKPIEVRVLPSTLKKCRYAGQQVVQK